MSKQAGDFVLENDDKIERALHGTITREGKLSGGVSDNASSEVLLAEYDRLGGLITKNGVKVKTGAFYDFGAKKPREVPELSFMTEVDGEIVEVSEEEAQAVKAAKEKTAEIKAKRKSYYKKKVKIKTPNEDYEEKTH